MNVVGLIPARASSKRLPNKNLIDCDGRPLISYTCAAAVSSGVLSAVYVNTDSPQIAAVARDCGVACPVLRPPHLALDDSPTREANLFLLEFLARRGEVYETVMVLQPTSPLRSAADVREALALFEANAPCAVVSVSPVAPASWLGRIGKDGRFDPLLGQEIVWRLNGAVYIHRCEDYVQNRRAPRTMVYPMSATCGVDVDTPDDLQYAAYLLRQRLAGARQSA